MLAVDEDDVAVFEFGSDNSLRRKSQTVAVKRE